MAQSAPARTRINTKVTQPFCLFREVQPTTHEAVLRKGADRTFGPTGSWARWRWLGGMGEELVPGVPPVPLVPGGADGVPRVVDPTEPVRRLLRDLRTDRRGLSGREAARRLDVVGPNELPRRRGEPWWRELVRQVSDPLALLLWAAGSPRMPGCSTAPSTSTCPR